MNLTEEDVKKRYIEPALSSSGWTFDKISMEKRVIPSDVFTDGKVIVNGKRTKRGTQKRADYLLYHHNNYPIAIVEAKDLKHSVHDGIQQAIEYARTLDVPFAYSTNGKGFLEHDMLTGREREFSMQEFPTSDELWSRYKNLHSIDDDIESVIKTAYHYREGGNKPRYYQRIAINRAVEFVAKVNKDANLKKRAMLVMATGTGKTYTAFQIIHRLYTAGLVKKVLYLADRNILIDQTILDDFAPFKNKNVITKVEKKILDSAYDIFMSLYQQLSGEDDFETFKQFKPDFFDLIIVDECHRGSAKENSAWRKVLDYFSDAIHLGMTATPKETDDVSNSEYFGEPIYTYSLKQGIDDGFLAPYRVLRFGIDKDLEGYIPESGKLDIYGNEIEQRVYTSKDFDKKIIIDERTKIVAKRITEYLKETDRFAKTIVFCVDIDHAARMRQALINENSDLVAQDDRYVTKITGDDQFGKSQLENFSDMNSKYPVIATTSELLTTGVNIKLCKVIVLDTVINSMTKFKQIIGRGTRLVWDRDKRFFSILDFRKATLLFSDPEFDGPATSVYVGPLDKPYQDEDSDFVDDSKEDLIEDNIKYRVTDVDAKIISEMELYYGIDGKLVANHSENFKKIILEEFVTHEVFKKQWLTEEKTVIINRFEEKGVNLNDLLDKAGSEVDIYDLISMIGFDREVKLKFERVKNVTDSPYYKSLDKEISVIVDDLLEVYLKHDASVLEDISVLELQTFGKYGGIVHTIRRFGNKKQYLSNIQTIVNLLYKN